jgi:hypothetical protein
MEQKMELIRKAIREMDTDRLYEEALEMGIVSNKEAFEQMLVMYFLVAA